MGSETAKRFESLSEHVFLTLVRDGAPANISAPELGVTSSVEKIEQLFRESIALAEGLYQLRFSLPT